MTEIALQNSLRTRLCMGIKAHISATLCMTWTHFGLILGGHQHARNQVSLCYSMRRRYRAEFTELVIARKWKIYWYSYLSNEELQPFSLECFSWRLVLCIKKHCILIGQCTDLRVEYRQSYPPMQCQITTIEIFHVSSTREYLMQYIKWVINISVYLSVTFPWEARHVFKMATRQLRGCCLRSCGTRRGRDMYKSTTSFYQVGLTTAPRLTVCVATLQAEGFRQTAHSNTSFK